MLKILVAILSALLASLQNYTITIPEPDYYNMEWEDLMNAVDDGRLTPKHGIVVEETFEGWAESDDIYVIDVDGILYEVESDDLLEGDEVTCYFTEKDKVARTLYGWRWKSPFFL